MAAPTLSCLQHGTSTFVFEEGKGAIAILKLAHHLGYEVKDLDELRKKIIPFYWLGTKYPNQILTAVLQKLPGSMADVWEVSVSPAPAETAGIVEFKKALIREIKTLDEREEENCRIHEEAEDNSRPYRFSRPLFGTLDPTQTGPQLLYKAVHVYEKGGYPDPN